MSTIAAGTSTTTALVATGDTTGQLVLQTNGTTTAVTIDTSQNTTHVGSSTATAHIPSGSSVPINGLYLPATNTPAISSNTTKVLSVVKGSSLALEGATPQIGTGISFPAAQVASSDVNTLDDYEEGSWTPVLEAASGTVTSYSYQQGSYTKVGNLVFARFWIDISNKGTLSGNLKVTGLPFLVGVTGAVCSFDDFQTGSLVITSALGYPTSTSILLSVIKASATGSVYLTAADVQTAYPDFYGAVVYSV